MQRRRELEGVGQADQLGSILEETSANKLLKNVRFISTNITAHGMRATESNVKSSYENMRCVFEHEQQMNCCL